MIEKLPGEHDFFGIVRMPEEFLLKSIGILRNPQGLIRNIVKGSAPVLEPPGAPRRSILAKTRKMLSRKNTRILHWKCTFGEVEGCLNVPRSACVTGQINLPIFVLSPLDKPLFLH